MLVFSLCVSLLPTTCRAQAFEWEFVNSVRPFRSRQLVIASNNLPLVDSSCIDISCPYAMSDILVKTDQHDEQCRSAGRPAVLYFCVQVEWAPYNKSAWLRPEQSVMDSEYGFRRVLLLFGV